MELGLGGSVSAPFIDLDLYFEIVLHELLIYFGG